MSMILFWVSCNRVQSLIFLLILSFMSDLLRSTDIITSSYTRRGDSVQEARKNTASSQLSVTTKLIDSSWTSCLCDHLAPSHRHPYSFFVSGHLASSWFGCCPERIKATNSSRFNFTTCASDKNFSYRSTDVSPIYTSLKQWSALLMQRTMTSSMTSIECVVDA